MLYDNKIWVGGTDKKCFIKPTMANRHGFIAGATGTGKSTTIKVLAESFSDLGVPVFLADIKGDMSGLSCAGQSSSDMDERIAKFGIDNFAFQSYPTTYYDVFGQMGIPMRTTISEIGPILLGRMLNLSDVQRAVLSTVFRIADDNNWLVLDLKDLRLLLTYVGDHASEYKLDYGNIAPATIGAIQRNLALLTDEGADAFFSEPAFDIADFIKCDASGRGVINVLNATELFNKPLLYSTFMLWLMSELYENLPEVGDQAKPKMVFFFDEAHLLFDGAPAFLIEKIDQIVRLIRSKGVGIYFISQSPRDIPENILNQLQNRIQHALRAYTPAEQKNIKAAAESYRANPNFDTETAISELAVGEALISMLDETGAPEVVERAFILPPQSYIGPAGFEKIDELTKTDPLYAKYKDAVDPESAYEILMGKYGQATSPSSSVTSSVSEPDKYVNMPEEEPAAAAAPVVAAASSDTAKTDKDRAAEIREQRELDRQEDRERRIEQQERREQERQEDRERKEEERLKKEEEKERKEQERLEEKAKKEEEKARKEQERLEEKARKEAEKQAEKEAREKEKAKKNSPLTKIANSAMTSAGRQIGSSLIRGIFGNLLK